MVVAICNMTCKLIAHAQPLAASNQIDFVCFPFAVIVLLVKLHCLLASPADPNCVMRGQNTHSSVMLEDLTTSQPREARPSTCTMIKTVVLEIRMR